jgi:hypothetical protein
MGEPRQHSNSEAAADREQRGGREELERVRRRAAAEAAFERAAIEAIALRLEGRYREANEAARKARWLYRDWKDLEDSAP